MERDPIAMCQLLVGLGPLQVLGVVERSSPADVVEVLTSDLPDLSALTALPDRTVDVRRV